MPNVEIKEPVFDGGGINLPEHKKPEIIASRMYLVACYRETEKAPFSYDLQWGHSICGYNESYFKDYYRFYLLPQYVEKK
jgi:hypothetical protein